MTNQKEEFSLEYMNNIVGGTYLESASDAKNFKAMGKNVYGGDIFGVPILQRDEFIKLRANFSKYGVTLKDNSGLINANEYFIGDRKVTRDEAWNHINQSK